MNVFKEMDKLVMDYFIGVVFGSVGSAQFPHRQPTIMNSRSDDQRRNR